LNFDRKHIKKTEYQAVVLKNENGEVKLAVLELIYEKDETKGHPFMTSTRMGSGSGGRGRGSNPMWTSTQKIKIRVHRRHPVFFSCTEVGVFLNKISSLDGIKSGKFSAI